MALLARWGTTVVLRYIADAPLSTLTEVYLKRVRDGSSATLRGALGTATVPKYTTNLQQQQIDEEDDASLASASASSTAPVQNEDAEFGSRYIFNKAKLSFHLAGDCPSFSRRVDWKTPCGFHFGATGFEWITEIPEGKSLCGQCQRWLKRNTTQ